jgi:hypothetical protein
LRCPDPDACSVERLRSDTGRAAVAKLLVSAEGCGCMRTGIPPHNPISMPFIPQYLRNPRQSPAEPAAVPPAATGSMSSWVAVTLMNAEEFGGSRHENATLRRIRGIRAPESFADRKAFATTPARAGVAKTFVIAKAFRCRDTANPSQNLISRRATPTRPTQSIDIRPADGPPTNPYVRLISMPPPISGFCPRSCIIGTQRWTPGRSGSKYEP